MSDFSKIRVADCETTGFPEEGGRLVEAAWNDIDIASKAVGPMFSTLVNPGVPIPPTASAVHHIVDADVASAPAPEEILARFVEGWETTIFAAHNRRFDQQFLVTPEGAKWICTDKVAKRVMPHASTHSNQGLRYLVGLEVDPVLSMPPHRAPADCHVTTRLLLRMLAKFDVEDMIRWTEEPVYMPTLEYGKKHPGKPWADVPTDYIRWMCHEADYVPADVLENAKFHLQQRGW